MALACVSIAEVNSIAWARQKAEATISRDAPEVDPHKLQVTTLRQDQFPFPTYPRSGSGGTRAATRETDEP